MIFIGYTGIYTEGTVETECHKRNDIQFILRLLFIFDCVDFLLPFIPSMLEEVGKNH